MPHITKEQLEEFDKVTEPLRIWLGQHHHPHTTIILTSTTAELVEGLICVNDKTITAKQITPE